MDRQILTLLVEPIRNDLAITDTQISILSGFAFAILYTLVGLPIGRLVDIHSRRLIIAIGAFTWSVMTALCGLANSFWQLFLARTGVGVGEATLSPSAYSLITDYFPPEKLARAMSIYIMAIFIGAGGAMMIGGLIVAMVPAGSQVTLPVIGVIGQWQLAFIIVSLPGLLVAGLMFTVREPARKGLSSSLSTDNHIVPVKTVIRYGVQRWRVFLPHFVGFSLFNILGNGIAVWIPTFFIRTHALGAGEIGAKFGLLLLLFGTLGVVLAGTLADQLRQRGIKDAPMRLSAIAVLLIIPFAIAMVYMPNDTWAFVMLAPTILLMSVPAVLAPTALQLITPNQLRGQFSAAFLFATTLLGLGLGPTLVALLTDYVFADATAVGHSLAVVTLIAGLLSVLVLKSGLRPFRQSLETVTN